LVRYFRWKVIGLSVGGVLIISVLVLLMYRTALMILRPVDALVVASRKLVRAHFDDRMKIAQHDEFDELAQACHYFGQHLQANESCKIEMLHQVALALNHEMNNAMAIIDLQLQLLQRQSNGSRAFEECIHQIHASLQQIVEVVERLKHVRRVVLTDYVDGVKMLDLERSAQDDLVASSGPFAQMPEQREHDSGGNRHS